MTLSIAALPVPSHIPPHYMEILLSKVSLEKQRKIARFLRKEDAYRSLLGELLVRQAIIRHTELTNREIRFAANAYGKPFLQNKPEFCFNLSHSGQWVVMIWGWETAFLGIDVEKIAPMDMKLAERFFSPPEYEALLLQTGESRLDYFFHLWTLKESYIKALGKGLSIPLDSFTIARTAEGNWHCPENACLHFKSFRLDPAHILSACSGTADIPDEIQYAHWEEILDSLPPEEIS